jgi:hypothetical protein
MQEDSTNSAPLSRRELRLRRRRSARARRFIAAAVGMALVSGVAYAASNWAVSLNTGSSGEAQSSTVGNLTITAVATPSPTNLLYPGTTGDVVLTITNPNSFPVSLSALNLPTNTTYAGGFSNSGLTTAQTGCTTATSYVLWNFATATSGSSHTLTSTLTIGASGNANNPLTVTLTNDASMTTNSPAACENTYFSMPSLTGVTASATTGTATTSPVTDGWTS